MAESIYKLHTSGGVYAGKLTVDASDPAHIIITDANDAELFDSRTVSDKAAIVAVTSPAAGATPRSVSIQVQDLGGSSLAEQAVFGVAVCNDADGAANSTNATITVSTGTKVKDVTATKDLIVKADATGLAVIAVANATTETVYLVIYPTRRSKALDCSQYATVTTT
jgi:hypothetical protein